jgi:hypothetical protein
MLNGVTGPSGGQIVISRSIEMIYRRPGGVKVTLFGRFCEGVGDVDVLGEVCSLIRLDEP